MRTALLLLAAALLFATPAMADFHGPGAGGPGGPGGPGMPRPCIEVRQVFNAPPNARCELVGHIDREIGPGLYDFRDRSGSIQVRIDRRTFRGRDVSPRTTVKIFGAARRDRGRTVVDVDRLEIR